MVSRVERQLHQEHRQSLQWVQEDECQHLLSFLMQVLMQLSVLYYSYNNKEHLSYLCSQWDVDTALVMQQDSIYIYIYWL